VTGGSGVEGSTWLADIGGGAGAGEAVGAGNAGIGSGAGEGGEAGGDPVRLRAHAWQLV
jgi:hypothetical protein